MSGRAMVTREAVLALLSQPQTATMTQADIGAAFGVTKEAAGNVLRPLLASGHIVATKDAVLPTLHYALSGKADVPVVQPFKWDIWTPPLQGYDARMQAAMSMRAP